jgi:spore coat protein H
MKPWMPKWTLLGLMVSLGIVGCGETDSAPMAAGRANPAGGASDATGGASNGTKSTWYKRDANELFDVDHVPRFEFTLPADKWQWLNDNALLEQYVQSDANYEGQSAGTVGIRFKGSYGTLNNCIDSTGKLTCAKLSLKINFEEYDTTNRFYGLKRLNLHSMVNDSTKLHERISYELYRLSDVKAPRSSWANVTVNGKDYGLFSMVEDIDGRFTADRWPSDGNGNLYKEAWPESVQSYYYTAHLETNKTTPDTSGIVSFATEFNAADSSNSATVLGKWSDLSYWYRYMAVDDAIVNCDGITAIYAAGATGVTWGNHNFYIHQEQNRNFFWLVVWDLDATMTTCAQFASVPNWSIKPADCSVNYAVWGDAWVNAPGCDRIFQALAQDRASYQSAVDQLLAGPFKEQTVLDKIDKWAAFIQSSVVADPTGAGESSWMTNVAQLKSTVPLLRQRLGMLRDGKPIDPLILSVTALNDFETTSSVGAKLGLVCYANTNTDCVYDVNTSNALVGQQDIRLNFTYRDPTNNPGQGWQQWIYYFWTFAGGFHDLTQVARLHLVLRTDHPRTVRIDLESDLYQAPNKGIKFGWDVPVTNQPTTVDLLLDSAKLPSWGTGTTDVLANVRTHINGLAFNPSPVGRDALGYLGANASDPGYLEIDNVQFVSP